MTVWAGLLGAGVGLGVFLTVVGLLPIHDPKPTGRRSSRRVDDLVLRVVLATAAGLGVLMVTRWPVAALAAAAGGAVVPSVRRTGRSRREAVERTEAVAAWTEMLRDTIAAAAGLNEAIDASARVAPAPIRTEVARLAHRAEHQPLSDALRRFADELADPVADTVVAALVLSTEHQAGQLGPVLGQIAANAREQAAMRLRVEASRARTYASARFVVVVTLAFSFGLIVLAPDYLRAFRTVEGQLMLTVIGGTFAASLWGLHRLGQPAIGSRLLEQEPES